MTPPTPGWAPGPAPQPRHPGRERQRGAKAGHYTQVRSHLNAAESDVTQLLDLLNAGIAADDLSREHAGWGGGNASPGGEPGGPTAEPR